MSKQAKKTETEPVDPNLDTQQDFMVDDLNDADRDEEDISDGDNIVDELAAIRALSAGYTGFRAQYEGSGDSGGVEHITAYSNARDHADTKNEDKLVSEVNINTNSPLGNAVCELVHTIIAQRHGGWENNDGGSGLCSIDLDSGKILLDHTERYTETKDYNYAFKV